MDVYSMSLCLFTLMKIMFVYSLLSRLSVGATLDQHTVAEEDPRYLIVMVAGFVSTVTLSEASSQIGPCDLQVVI